MQKGIIELEEMEFYAYHGCFKEEQVVGNRFMVNIAIQVDVEKPSHSDNINDALNYVSVYELTRQEIQQNSHLVEHLTERILNAIHQKFDYVDWVKVKVSKMNPPMGGQMKAVSVTMQR
ncbi:dihydroneopterin aldolase [Saccharicrinis fermentans]|uniref:7,8-dihydroneopterin aldolase n=1 Tax=Saccharicrinis fermentans DSM 9555 = JCM 21142 TaxID=869213 RepID=W7YLB2_9BACT|nr:dihydroneopterin aldolase [Saccharicrinis fermentans]GAF05346.1 dihydroneopterin aldolase [Saccharicrinis fermentans DSM 9555 = JCM 21142]